MPKRFLKSENGISLVEVLTTLAIIGIFSAVIINYMVSGMNSYKRVNDEISLHDEANYVMQQFINYICEATKVEVLEQDGNNSIIKVKNYDGKETTLGFENYQAVVNDTAIHPEKFTFTNESTIDLKGEKTVSITIFVEDPVNGKNLKLENEVSYLKAK